MGAGDQAGKYQGRLRSPAPVVRLAVAAVPGAAALVAGLAAALVAGLAAPLVPSLAAALVAATAWPLAACADESAAYPTRTVRIIVPLAPGGNLDLVARAVAEPLGRYLGQAVIVENHPGTAALVGTQFVARSPPDGYTLLAQSNTFVSAAAIMPDAGYDPAREFAAITLTCRIPMALVVNPAVPVKTVKELIDWIRAHPKEAAYASSGIGSTAHIAAERFSRFADLKMLHVAYKGNSQAMLDVISGQVPILFDQVSTAEPQIHAGRVRGLAVTSLTRAAILPELPTLDEAGLRGYEDTTWNGLFAPAGTPRDVLVRLRDGVARAMASPELIKRFGEHGVELAVSASPEEFGAFIRDEVTRYVKLVNDAHIKPD
jgi:tripartite-type tricarboxylate transporter receptor subunit TctC